MKYLKLVSGVVTTPYLLEYAIKSAVSRLEENDIQVDKNIIYSMINRKCDTPYWHLNKTNSGMKLMFFKPKQDNEYTLARGKNIVYSDAPEIWEIKNCILIVDLAGKSLQCLRKDRNLFFVTQQENKYFGYLYI